MSEKVSDLLVNVLEQIGVRQIFALIGDSLNSLANAIRQSSIEWIGVRHEEGAALAAAGQAKLTGRIGVCAGTTGPGSTHLIAGLYEAARDHAPVLAISGDMPRRLQGSDYIQATKPDFLFRDVSLFTETILTAEQAPHLIHQAIATAYAGRGVAHLTIPQDLMNSKAVGSVSSINTLTPRPEFAASDEAIDGVVQQINKADDIAILCGSGCHGLAKELGLLSDKLKAPLIHTVKGKDILPYADPRWMGGIGMIGTKAGYHAIMNCDLLLMIGTDYPYSEFLPRKGKLIQIDDRYEVLGRRAPAILGIFSSAGPALKSLLDRVTQKSKTNFFEKVTKERQKWDKILDKQADITRSKDKIHPQAVARLAGDLAKDDAVFIIDVGLNTLWSGNWIRQRGTQRIIGSFNNAAVGTSLGQANGIQALNRSRQVIALCGDGGFNMLMSEFLTTVHHKLPVKIIIFNNASFGLIKLESESIGVPPYYEGIKFPNPDFELFARACGGHGFSVKQPSELKSTLEQAFSIEGPAIIDVVISADELPNVPHIDLKLVENVAIAKVKEAINSVMGS